MGQAVSALVSAYKTEQAGRVKTYVRNVELFEGRALGGYSGHSYASYAGENEFEEDRQGIVRAMTRTAVAEIYGHQKPKAQFQTQGATWSIRRKAKRLDKIEEGISNQRQGRWINLQQFMLREAGPEIVLQGVACVKVTADTTLMRICHELVPNVRLFVDPSEGRTPQNLFEISPMSQGAAMERWKGKEKAIDGAPEFDWNGYKSSSTTTHPRADKIIEVQYGWRLPFGPDKPGVFCTVIGGELMEAPKEWDAPAFPFVFVGWEPHRDGFWWSGLGDEVGRLARVAGDVDERLLRRFKIGSRNVTYYPIDTIKREDLELNDEHVNIPYEGAIQPNDVQIPPFHAMEVEFARWKVQQCWAAGGVSESNAAARKEPGINSGIGLITLNDTKTGVQLPRAKAFEQGAVDLAHQHVWRMRELEKHAPGLVMKFPGKRLIMAQKWGEADVEDDMFSVTVGEASSLPRDPAGRQQVVQEMFNNGLIQPETARELMGWPDIQGEMEVDGAETEYIDMLIETYLDADEEGEDKWSDADYESPVGFILNKPAALKRFGAAWFKARVDQQTLPRDERQKVEFNLALLVRYITELDGMMRAEAEKQAALEAENQAAAQAQAEQQALALQQQQVAVPQEQIPIQ
jgi:hypothetical protein